MKKITTPLYVFVICVFSLMLSGCAKKTESLAYVHEPTEEILSFYDDGTCVYKGAKFSYTKDDSFIYLKTKDGLTVKLRYTDDGTDKILYEKSTYVYTGEGTPDGIVGDWKQENGWEYVFTEDGKFSEDGIFYGYYFVDTEKQAIYLKYVDRFEDATLYYTIADNKLVIDYPWPVVETKDVDDTLVDSSSKTAGNN
ncbi:hypothetical protein [Butyrivibrio proteoclasticus]|uniref:hypothetical protein n=1 Tax=Butyrivibrio proteoclasticus TaxID=43305 RepID=UPI000558EFF2|nr:hypothetical protein [Butyrivibrio proteoclasticus]